MSCTLLLVSSIQAATDMKIACVMWFILISFEQVTSAGSREEEKKKQKKDKICSKAKDSKKKKKKTKKKKQKRSTSSIWANMGCGVISTCRMCRQMCLSCHFWVVRHVACFEARRALLRSPPNRIPRWMMPSCRTRLRSLVLGRLSFCVRPPYLCWTAWDLAR